MLGLVLVLLQETIAGPMSFFSTIKAWSLLLICSELIDLDSIHIHCPFVAGS